MRWAEPLFGPERRLAYRMSFNGRPFADQWTVPLGEIAPGLFAFELMLELDPNVLGHGGSVLRARSRLECDASFSPVRYVSEVSGARMEVLFAAETITLKLPDGTKLDVPRNGARYLTEANYIGLDTLMLAHARTNELITESAELRMFLVNSAVTMPYKLDAIAGREAPAGARWYRSSLHEEVLVGPTGLEQSLNLTAGVKVEHVVPPTPLPEWTIPPVVVPARYVPPADATFRLEDVRIPGPVVELGATVTIPHGDGPFPAVVFIGGSGTHDRHGIAGELDTGSHEIVDDLAARGVLGVRYDTRGAGSTTVGPDALQDGLESIIADARAVVAWTLAHPAVDPRRLFLVGHSQGGTVALALVARHGVEPAGVVLLATLGRSMEAVSRDQVVTGAKMLGYSDEQLTLQLARNREMFDLVRSNVPWTEEHVPAIHLAAAPVVPWLREYLAYEPVELAKQVRCPTLILHGSADFQVSPEADSEALAAAAREGTNDVTIETLPGLDHLFKPAPDGSSTLASYYTKDRKVDAGFLDRLAGWIMKRAAT